MSQRVVVVFLVVLMGFGSGMVAARGPSATAQVQQVEGQINSGSIEPQRDLAPLLDALRTTKSDADRSTLIFAIQQFGRADGNSPAAVKSWLLAHAPEFLLAVASDKKAGWAVRGDALLALRWMEAPDAVLDQAISIAQADRSEQRDFIQSRGELLTTWKQARQQRGGAPTPAKPIDAVTEQKALAYLRANDVDVSQSALEQAAIRAEVESIAALLDAGIDVNGSTTGEPTVLVYASQISCSAQDVDMARQLATIDLLVSRGLDVNRADSLGNTALISAVQSCPLAIIDKLLAIGMKPDPINAQGFTPLKMALVSGHWPIAERLIEKGARLSSADADQLFFEPPQDPAQRAILARAIKGGK